MSTANQPSHTPDKGEKIEEPMSHKKHLAIQAAFAAPGILMDIKSMFSAKDADPGISSVIMAEVASAVGETVADLAVPFFKILSVGWKIRTAIKAAKDKAVAEIRDVHAQILVLANQDLRGKGDRNDALTDELLDHTGGLIADTNIKRDATPTEQRTSLLNLIAYLQGSPIANKLSGALGEAKAKEQEIGKRLETLDAAEEKNDVLCKILEEVGIPPEKEMAMFVDAFQQLNAGTEPVQDEAQEIPAAFMKGDITAVKIDEQKVAGQKPLAPIGNTMTMEFPEGTTLTVGSAMPFGKGTLRPTKITPLTNNSYRVEMTSGSIYIISKTEKRSYEIAAPANTEASGTVVQETATTTRLLKDTMATGEPVTAVQEIPAPDATPAFENSAKLAQFSSEADRRAAGLSNLGLRRAEDETKEGVYISGDGDMCCFAYRLLRELQFSKNGKGKIDFGGGYGMEAAHEVGKDGSFNMTKPCTFVLRSPQGFLDLVVTEYKNKVNLNGIESTDRIMTTDDYRNNPTVIAKKKLFADIVSVAVVWKEQQKQLKTKDSSADEAVEEDLYRRMERSRSYWDNPLTLTTQLSRELLNSTDAALWNAQKNGKDGDGGGQYIGNGKIPLPNGMTITLTNYTCSYYGDYRGGDITIEDGKDTTRINCDYGVENKLNGNWMNYHTGSFGAVESGMRLLDVIEALKRFPSPYTFNPLKEKD